MSRPCAVCSHARRHEIEDALRSGQSLRMVAAAFGVGKNALHRHAKHAGTADALHPVSNPLIPEAEEVEQVTQPANAPAPAPPQPRTSPLTLEQNIRRAVLLRARGVVPSIIAENLGITEKTLSAWFQRYSRENVAELQAQTRESLVADLRASHAALLADLLLIQDAARAKGDTRTMLEVARERRQLLREVRDTIEKLGAFDIRLPSDADNPNDELSLASMARKLASIFVETDTDGPLLDFKTIEAKVLAGEYPDDPAEPDHLH